MTLLAGGVLTACGEPAAAAAQSTDSLHMKSVLAGAYTVVQARSGEAVFKNICAQCHVATQFSDANFQRSWAGRTARDLFELIRTQMPQDNPGSLSREQYAATLAYIFELSGYPPGNSPLPTDSAGLRRVRMERKPTPPPPTSPPPP